MPNTAAGGHVRTQGAGRARMLEVCARNTEGTGFAACRDAVCMRTAGDTAGTTQLNAEESHQKCVESTGVQNLHQLWVAVKKVDSNMHFKTMECSHSYGIAL